MILLTGATGHIGNVLARKLVERGERVRALVFPREDLAPLEGVDIECVPGDVLSTSAIQRAMRGVTDVFHLAGVISIWPGKNAWMHHVNVDGTLNMLHAARQAGVRRFVYTSSIHALGRCPHGMVIDESAPFDMHSPSGGYDCTKAEASLQVQAAAAEGLPAVIVCPTGVIGPYDYRVSEMGRLILNTMRSKIHLTLDGAYDFVDVRDVADGMIAAWQNGRVGGTYILSGEQIGVPSLMALVRAATGKHAWQLKVPMPLAKAAARLSPIYCRLSRVRPLFTQYSLETLLSNSVVSNAKARLELGYQPRPLTASVADAVGWFRETRY